LSVEDRLRSLRQKTTAAINWVAGLSDGRQAPESTQAEYQDDNGHQIQPDSLLSMHSMPSAALLARARLRSSGRMTRREVWGSRSQMTMTQRLHLLVKQTVGDSVRMRQLLQMPRLPRVSI